MGVRETSRESYHKIADFGDQQRKVFETFKRLEPATDRQVAMELDIPANRVTARRHKLVEWGFIVEHGRTYDSQTKRNVITWVTADPFAQHAVEKVVEKSTEKTEKKQVKKYSLKLKSGKLFTINEDMKNEIEEAMSVQRGSGGKITLAGHEFVLSQIVIPIREQGVDEEFQTIKNEATRTVVLEIRDGQWLPTDRSEASFRRSQTQFRTQRIGVESGRIISDFMTIFSDGYESIKDMKQSAS